MIAPKINAHQYTVHRLSTCEAKESILPALVRLSTNTEMSGYGVREWDFLLQAGNVTTFVIFQPDSIENLWGCVLRIDYGFTHTAYGMMLVSPEARGQGLARKSLLEAMGPLDDKDMHILGACTNLGKPVYERMGFGCVSTVTKMTVYLDCMSLEPNPNEAVQMETSSTRFQEVLNVDRQATGLDRSETLRAIHDHSNVSTATITKEGNVAIAALIRKNPSNTLLTIGPILGQEALVPTLLCGIQTLYRDHPVEQLSMIVSDHPSLVKMLTNAGFETNFELPAMTLRGISFPGNRDLYLALIHPTLG